MYKLSYYRFGELKLDYRSAAGYDRTRNTVIGNKDFSLTYLEEAYTTEHWLVRIYRYLKVTIYFIYITKPFVKMSFSGHNREHISTAT